MEAQPPQTTEANKQVRSRRMSVPRVAHAAISTARNAIESVWIPFRLIATAVIPTTRMRPFVNNYRTVVPWLMGVH